MLSSAIDTHRLLRETFVARVEHHAAIGSTNDRAKQCAAEGAGPLPLLVVADVQTAGRGRGANRWWTGRGSLACSLLVDVGSLSVDRSRWTLVGILAGVAIVETVAPLLPSHLVGLRWPNDVYAAGRKLAGILVEVVSDRLHVIGIGLNTNNALAEAPAELRDTATTLVELTGIQHDQTTILATLLHRVEDGLRELAAAPERVGARADAMCLQRGKMLTVQSGQRSVTGRCAGIAADGALLLDTPDGRQKLYSGNVCAITAT